MDEQLARSRHGAAAPPDPAVLAHLAAPGAPGGAGGDEAAEQAPAPAVHERLSALAALLLSALYLWVAAWLVAWVAIPAVAMGLQPTVITSGSMQPVIRPGDVILSAAAPEEPLEPGSVITFADAGRKALVTHRVVDVNDDGTYRTRGDANEHADSTAVDQEAVVGVGRMVIPLVGYPLVWLRSSPAWFVVWLAATMTAISMTSRRGVEVVEELQELATDEPVGTTAPLRRSPWEWSPRIDTRDLRRRVEAVGQRALAPRRPASRLRALAPPVVAFLASSLVWPTAAGMAVSAGLALLVLLGDPRGVELRIGRWRRLPATLRDRRRAAASARSLARTTAAAAGGAS